LNPAFIRTKFRDPAQLSLFGDDPVGKQDHCIDPLRIMQFSASQQKLAMNLFEKSRRLADAFFKNK
jgi:hypothetical protein